MATARELVFITASSKDSEWLDRLRKHLAPTELPVWDKRDIKTGAQRQSTIEVAVDHACVAVLLVSSDFLASEEPADFELPRILEAAKRGDLRIIWVPVRACMWKNTPLAAYQSALDARQPLSALRGADRDEALLRVSQEIDVAHREMRGRPEKSGPARATPRSLAATSNRSPSPRAWLAMSVVVLSLCSIAVAGLVGHWIGTRDRSTTQSAHDGVQPAASSPAPRRLFVNCLGDEFLSRNAQRCIDYPTDSDCQKIPQSLKSGCERGDRECCKLRSGFLKVSGHAKDALEALGNCGADLDCGFEKALLAEKLAGPATATSGDTFVFRQQAKSEFARLCDGAPTSESDDRAMTAESCVHLGVIALEEGVLDASIPRFKRACIDFGLQLGCALEGEARLLVIITSAGMHDGASPEEKTATEVLNKACGNGEARGCLKYGAYLESKGQHRLALGRYEAGCKFASDRSRDLTHQPEYLLALSFGGALNHYLRALTSRLAVRKGEPVWSSKDSGHDPIEFNPRATDATRCCWEAAAMLHAGRDVGQDKVKANLYYSAACDAGDARGCLGLGDLRRETGEMEDAITSLARGCELGSPSSCLEAGDLLEQSRVKRIAAQLFYRRCANITNTASGRLGKAIDDTIAQCRGRAH